MEIDRLNRWLTFLANIGVIAGLVFLVLEIQQSNRIAVAATEIEVRNSFSSINASIYTDPELSRLMVRLVDIDVDLALDEDIRV